MRHARRRGVPAPPPTRDTLRIGVAALLVFWSVNVMLSGDLVDSRFFWLWLCVWELYRRRMVACASQA
jgi:hypothetical protein